MAGKNFGCGKAHSGYKEMVCLGVRAILAVSAPDGFIKGCVNENIPILFGEEIASKIQDGDELDIDVETGLVKNLTTGETITAKHPVQPGHPFYPIREAGGYVPFLRKKVEEGKRKEV